MAFRNSGGICVPSTRGAGLACVVRRFAILLLLVVSLVGCIILPLPATQKVLSGTPLTKDKIAFLAPKVTTTQEVIERLGKPQYIWEDARIFVYDWEIRQGILLFFVGAAAGGVGGVGDIPEQHVFVIQFDEQDRAHRWEEKVRPLSQSIAEFLMAWYQESLVQLPNGSRVMPQVKRE